MEMKGSWGPQDRRAAVTVSFDNFGEAAELEFGMWPHDKPVGQHYTAKVVLPRLLRELEGTRVTFFIEGWNAEVYPDELKSIAAAGHDLGLHGWRHEIWALLDEVEQRENLDRSLRAMEAIGVRPVGFRPPGGDISDAGSRLLRQYGISYCSPVARAGAAPPSDLQVFEFHWRHIDGFYLDPMMEPLRVKHGGRQGSFAPREWADVLNVSLRDAISRGDHLVVIFHPYLFGREAQHWSVLSEFIRGLRENEDVWFTSCDAIADWSRQSVNSVNTSRGPGSLPA